MKIGLNLLWVRPYTGIHTYAYELLNALGRIDSGDQYVLFVNRDNHEDFGYPGEMFRQIVCNVPAKSRMRKVIGEQLWLPRQASRERLDLIHSLSNVAPLATPCPSVLTLHDVGAFAFPEAWSRLRGPVLRFVIRASARRAAAIITDSEFSRREIASRLGVAEDRIFVAYSGVTRCRVAPSSSWLEIKARFRIGGDYAFAFSGPGPHKNIDNLLRAFARLRAREQRPCQLVVVGKFPVRGAELPELARQLGIMDSVVFTGYLDDPDVAMLLSHAALMAFPSLYEGFGLPALEAMQAGVPVACSNASCLPEVAGTAAIYFDPRDPEEMARAISALLSDAALRDRLVADGRRNVERFSWHEAALRTLEVYRGAARGSLPPHASCASANDVAFVPNRCERN